MKKNIYITLLAAGMTLAACNASKDLPGKEGIPEKIRLSSLSVDASLPSRAATDFPNDGSIGITATTVYNSAEPLNTDWTLYPDIQNAEATASSVDTGVYSFTWGTQKYYPFDGSDLYFMSYSPAVQAGNPLYTLNADKNTLEIGLDPAMPDVLYASNNVAPQAYNKTSGTVSLGEFRHALSRLVVEVVPDPALSQSIKVSRLAVATPVKSASLVLPLGDEGLTPVYSPDNYEIEFISANTDLSGTLSYEHYFFPGTEDYMNITITLVDQYNASSTFTGSYMMPEFINPNDPDKPLALVRAKTSVLRFLIKNIGVQQPDVETNLEGLVTDWNYQGRYGITIN